LTGDSDYAQQQDIRKANIIVTTPEKWDSTTRKWADSKELFKMLRLFLIDEVHFLKDESRGATLEVVVSRMKTFNAAFHGDKELRFIAMSATVPNVHDIASWLCHKNGSPAALK
jgi:ATP-dependent DNA helicase HFM1/MER3